MMFSVWNQGAWKYDYYESAAVQDTANAPRPTHIDKLGKATPMGLAPEQICWPLPRDSRKVGTGEYPRGRIARLPGPVDGNGSGVLGWRGDHPRPGDSDGLGALAGIPIIEDIPPVGLAIAMLGAYLWHRSR